MPRLLSAILRALVAALVAVPLLALPASADTVTSRAYGPDRIATAVQASEDFRDTATDVLLTTAFSYPDALAAGALAHRLDAPLLLTPPTELPTIVRDEIARLGAQTVWILGGESAVSGTVEATLQQMGVHTRRLAGETRYATAQAIAEAAGPSMTGEIVLALGEHADPGRAWPDAVASGALAATPDRIPTVLTRPDALPAETVEALDNLAVRDVIILGGETAISAAVEDHLIDLGYDTRRIAGGSRYDTSVALAEEALARFDATSQPAVFASGGAYPDALSAGSLAASLGAPLLLVPPRSQLPGSSEEFIREHADRLTRGVVVGGPAAADEYVVAQLDAALQGEPAPAREAPAQPPEEQALQEGDAQQEPPAEEQPLESFTGKASWYGPGLHGNQTANGETFDQYAMTAAHRTLPFNTMIRVTNLNNGRTVDLRINDRGPYAQDRVLDVSSGAADVLEMKADGVVQVHVQVLSYG